MAQARFDTRKVFARCRSAGECTSATKAFHGWGSRHWHQPSFPALFRRHVQRPPSLQSVSWPQAGHVSEVLCTTSTSFSGAVYPHSTLWTPFPIHSLPDKEFGGAFWLGHDFLDHTLHAHGLRALDEDNITGKKKLL